MDKKINLKIFRFDVQTDYLPYFSKLQIKIDKERTLSELLEKIKENLFGFAYNAYGFKINGIVVCDFGLKIEDLIGRFGLNWTIEPLNVRLVTKDLVIDTKPFLQKIQELERFGLNQSEDFVLTFFPFAYATPIGLEESSSSEVFFVLAYLIYQETNNEAMLEFVTMGENNIFNTLAIKNYVFPMNSYVDNYLNEFKKIIFKKSNHKEVKNLAKLLLNRSL